MSQSVDLKFQSNDAEKNGILLPLSPLFDATVDDDFLAVQSLISKNYDVNQKVWRDNVKSILFFISFQRISME